MKSTVTEFAAAQAAKLRLRGMKYADIASELEGLGVTLHWCKRNLREIKPATPKNNAAEEVLLLALRPEGAKNSEIYPIIHSTYAIPSDEQVEQKQLDDVKRAVKSLAAKQNQTALFVPEWMDRESPDDCLRLMLEQAEALHCRIEDMVAEHMALFPDSNRKAVRRELLALAIPDYQPEPVESRCTRNAETVDELLLRQATSTYEMRQAA